MGKFTITHPYHPLNGKSYDILKLDTKGGVRLFLFILGNEIYCVPESWTDRHIDQSVCSDATGIPFNAHHLAELADLLKVIKNLTENPLKPIDGLNI